MVRPGGIVTSSLLLPTTTVRVPAVGGGEVYAGDGPGYSPVAVDTVASSIRSVPKLPAWTITRRV